MADEPRPKFHLEQGDDEIYMGTVADRPHSSWLSTRLGQLFVPTNGPSQGLKRYPWFIKRSEVEAALHIPPGAPNRDERIRNYQAMLDNGHAFVDPIPPIQ